MSAPTSPTRRAADVSQLPTVTFGDRSLMWWGTLGFMVIEGWTLALLAGVYLYLRQHNQSWPPAGTPLPSLGVPTANVVMMLLSIIPNMMAARASKRFSRKAITVWLCAALLMGVLILALRWWELQALNTRWDSHAYGSAIWVLAGFHTSLLLVDVADTLVLTMFFLFKELPVKAVSDVCDNSFYWYFTIGSWIPLYLLVYLLPHFITGK